MPARRRIAAAAAGRPAARAAAARPARGPAGGAAAGRAPTRVRAQVLAELCWALRREDRHEEAERTAAELRALAGGSATRVPAEAMLLQAAVGASGRRTPAPSCGRHGTRRRDRVPRSWRAWAYLTVGLCAGGPRQSRARHPGRPGRPARARQLGLGRQVAAPIAGNLAESLTSAGRWDEAPEILEEILGLDLPPLGRVRPLLVRGEIAVARGDLETAGRTLGELRALPAGLHAEAQYALPLARLEIELPAGRGGPRRGPRRRGHIRPRTTRRPIRGTHGRCWPRRCGPAPTRPRSACRRRPRPGPAAQGPAEQAGAGGTAEARCTTPTRRRSRPKPPAPAASRRGRLGRRRRRLGRLGQPYPMAYALLRAAAAAAAGSRDGGGRRLHRAAELPASRRPAVAAADQPARPAGAHRAPQPRRPAGSGGPQCRSGSPPASRRSCGWSPPGAATGRSRPSCSSPTGPPASTSPTSSPSSGCPRGARPPPSRTGCTYSTSPDRPAGCGAPRCHPELIPYLMQAAGAGNTWPGRHSASPSPSGTASLSSSLKGDGRAFPRTPQITAVSCQEHRRQQ